MDRIQYNDGYKYQLKQDYALSVPLKPSARFDSDFLQLETDGRLLIKRGYAWDGPSGPTIDTLNFMRGSLVHDALYQLMREQCLDHIQDRAAADQLLRDICIADGMWRLRAWWVYHAVRWVWRSQCRSGSQTLPDLGTEIITLPILYSSAQYRAPIWQPY